MTSSATADPQALAPAKKRAPQLVPHHWKPGQSGNPTGARGIERIVRECIREQGIKTEGKDGWEAIVIAMFDIVMGRRPPGIGSTEIRVHDRIEAAKFLFDRGHGKARMTVDISGDALPTTVAGIDVDSLDNEQLADVQRALDEALRPRRAKAIAAKIIDVKPESKVKAK